MPVGFKGHVRAPNKDILQAVSAQRHRVRLHAISLRDIPASYDARNEGVIPPIKDQGQCGSCWDFSGTFVVEVALIAAGILTVNQPLSEQYTLSCGNNGGCNGDDNTTVLTDAKSHGLPLTSDYGPYTSGSGSSGSCKYNSGMKLFKIDDWGFADGSQGQNVTATPAIQAAILTYKCVGCAVAAGGDSFWDNGQGVGTGTSNQIDHDVGLLGWRPSGSSRVSAAVGTGITLPPVTVNLVDWIMRNSWNTSWGIGGYAWIREGAYSIGTESVWAKVANPNPPPPPYIDWASL